MATTERKSIKPVIYQLFPRLFTNTCDKCVPFGTIEQNGVGKMNDITDFVLSKIKDLGITHVWYTGVIEHAHTTDYSAYGIRPDNPYSVKGNAGSPYAITDYYDIDPDIAVDVPHRMDEFEALVKRTHAAGMKVIIDFVPNHVARQYHSDAKPAGIEDLGESDDTTMQFSPSNNFYYISRQQFAPHDVYLGEGDDQYREFPAKATGNDCFTAFPGRNDWYETVKLNYGIDYGNGSRHFSPTPDTWFKMLNILRFWCSKGIDGFRCDMAHMVPVEFWKWAVPLVKEKYPHVIFIAEIYDVGLYRDYIYNGGFDYLYDKVNLYDTLRGIQCNNVSAASLTNCWQTVDGIARHMLNFLENHDEQRFASWQYAGDASLVLPSLVVSATFATGPMMIYQGQELGERAIDSEGFSGRDGRTTIFDYWSIPTVRRWYNHGKCDDEHLSRFELNLRRTYQKVLLICNNERAIAEGAFFDLMYVNYGNLNPHRQFTYLRSYKNETLLIAVNFDNAPCSIDINIPIHAFECLGIKQGEVTAVDLLSDRSTTAMLETGTPFHTDIEANGAVIWKLTPLRRTSRSRTSRQAK